MALMTWYSTVAYTSNLEQDKKSRKISKFVDVSDPAKLCEHKTTDWTIDMWYAAFLALDNS